MKRRTKHVPNQHREDRIAEPSVRERHCAWHDSSTPRRKPAALNPICSFAESLDKLRDLTEIVAIVGVPHNNELAACRRNASHQSITISLSFDVNYSGTRRSRDP